MKTLISTTAIALIFSTGLLNAQDVTTVQATSSDISENLDLQAVAAVFGEARDLDDFERKLNDPALQICNLDLNCDGYVDYLRVVESSQNGTHLIVIQAVLGQDVYQDVATIDVERDNRGTARVQVVGDVYMYGPNYVIEPHYVHTPVIFVYFWSPRYRPWYSPYHWGYYPAYYSPWRPYPIHVYHHHVHVHVHSHYGHSYGYVGHRRSSAAMAMHRNVQRNDYAARNPERTFAQRNGGAENKRQLMDDRQTASSRTVSADGRTRQPVKPTQGTLAPTTSRQPQAAQKAPSTAVRTPEATGRQAVTTPAQQTASPQRAPAANPQRTPAVRPDQRPAPIAAPRQEQRQPQTQSPRIDQRQRQPERQSVAPVQKPAAQGRSAILGSAPNRVERQLAQGKSGSTANNRTARRQ